MLLRHARHQALDRALVLSQDGGVICHQRLEPRGHLRHPVRQRQHVERLRAQIIEPLHVMPPSFRRVQHRHRDEALHRRKHRRAPAATEQLVHAVRHENHPVLRPVVKDAEIILIAAISVPVADHGLQGHAGDEAVEIERALQCRLALQRIGFLCGGGQGVQRVMIGGRITGFHGQLRVHLPARALLVKISRRVRKVPFQKLFIPALDQQIHAQVAPVQLHPDMGHPRRGRPAALKSSRPSNSLSRLGSWAELFRLIF